MINPFMHVLKWREMADGIGSIGNYPSFANHTDKELELMAKLIEEEAREMADAIRGRNMTETADGAADVIWVVLDACAKLGLDPVGFTGSPSVFDEVARSNHDKVKDGVIRREDGKIMKPEGWTPPDILPIIEDQRSLVDTYSIVSTRDEKFG